MLRSLPHLWLDSLPGLSRDEAHRYHLSAHTFPVSVTGVLATQKSAIAMERIEATRADWEPRGNTCHLALELAATSPGFHPDHWPQGWPYSDWIHPLLHHPIWNSVFLCASEMGLYSLELNLAGTFDGAWLSKSSPAIPWRRTLFDLKSQGRADASAYDTRPQLGGYLTMAREHGIEFDDAATIWCRPGRTKIALYGLSECLEGWQEAWQAYQAQMAFKARLEAAGVLIPAGADPFSLPSS